MTRDLTSVEERREADAARLRHQGKVILLALSIRERRAAVTDLFAYERSVRRERVALTEAIILHRPWDVGNA
jgi:hypothetical protein